jgi:hypothetical protein
LFQSRAARRNDFADTYLLEALHVVLDTLNKLAAFAGNRAT